MNSSSASGVLPSMPDSRRTRMRPNNNCDIVDDSLTQQTIGEDNPQPSNQSNKRRRQILWRALYFAASVVAIRYIYRGVMHERSRRRKTTIKSPTFNLKKEMDESDTITNLVRRFPGSWSRTTVLSKWIKRVVVVAVQTVLSSLSRKLRLKFANNGVVDGMPSLSSMEEASLSELWHSLHKGEIRRAVWLASGTGLAFRTENNNQNQSKSSETGWKQVRLPPNQTTLSAQLMEALTKQGQQSGSNGVIVSTEAPSMASRMITPALTAIPFIYLGLLWYFMKDMHSSTNQGNQDLSKAAAELESSSRTAGRKRITFDDVAGLYEAKREMGEVVEYLRNPRKYLALGIEGTSASVVRPPRGILLHGDPGNGKTLLVRALAGEAEVREFRVCSGAEFVDTYVGRGAARIRSLFAQARRNNDNSNMLRTVPWRFWASNPQNENKRGRSPMAIIFMDEIDALAKTRGNSLTSSDERDQTLNQLLVELDGFDTADLTDMDDSSNGIIFVCATNRPDILDPALLRRMDRQIHVGLPSSDMERLEILQLYASRLKMSSCTNAASTLGLVARRTQGCSGSDLRNLVNEAALLAVREHCSSLMEHHLLRATEKILAQKRRRLSSVTVGLPNYIPSYLSS